MKRIVLVVLWLGSVTIINCGDIKLHEKAVSAINYDSLLQSALRDYSIQSHTLVELTQGVQQFHFDVDQVQKLLQVIQKAIQQYASIHREDLIGGTVVPVKMVEVLRLLQSIIDSNLLHSDSGKSLMPLFDSVIVCNNVEFINSFLSLIKHAMNKNILNVNTIIDWITQPNVDDAWDYDYKQILKYDLLQNMIEQKIFNYQDKQQIITIADQLLKSEESQERNTGFRVLILLVHADFLNEKDIASLINLGMSNFNDTWVEQNALNLLKAIIDKHLLNDVEREKIITWTLQGLQDTNDSIKIHFISLLYEMVLTGLILVKDSSLLMDRLTQIMTNGGTSTKSVAFDLIRIMVDKGFFNAASQRVILIDWIIKNSMVSDVSSKVLLLLQDALQKNLVDRQQAIVVSKLLLEKHLNIYSRIDLLPVCTLLVAKNMIAPEQYQILIDLCKKSIQSGLLTEVTYALDLLRLIINKGFVSKEQSNNLIEVLQQLPLGLEQYVEFEVNALVNKLKKIPKKMLKSHKKFLRLEKSDTTQDQHQQYEDSIDHDVLEMQHQHDATLTDKVDVTIQHAPEA